MLREQNKCTVPMILWAVLICCVVIGSLLPAPSPVMVAVGRLHVGDKVLHFCACLALSPLPMIGFRDRRSWIAAASRYSFLRGLIPLTI